MKELKKARYLRWGIQIIFFIFMPSIFTTAFSGIKYIALQVHNREVIELTAFTLVLGLVLAYTILFGRFFCGYACAFGTLGDILYEISLKVHKKLKIKMLRPKTGTLQKLQYIKYLLLFTIVLLSYLGLKDVKKGISPWDVFSMVTAGNFQVAGYAIGIVLLILIMVGMMFVERFFCQFLCPMGAVFAFMPVFPFSILRRDRENCITNCSACQNQCPVKLSIDGDSKQSGECISCGKCVHICPKHNIHYGIKSIKPNGTVFVLLKAVALYLLLMTWI